MTAKKETAEKQEECQNMLVALRWRVLDTLLTRIVEDDSLTNDELIQILMYFKQ